MNKYEKEVSYYTLGNRIEKYLMSSNDIRLLEHKK